MIASTADRSTEPKYKEDPMPRNTAYNVHITRKQNWWDDGPEISLDDWRALIEQEPDMRMEGAAYVEMSNGQMLRLASEGIAIWTNYQGTNGRMAWFDHWRGSIRVASPDKDILAKANDLALRLGAKVQGDDGVVYSPRASSAPEQLASTEVRKGWWRALKGTLLEWREGLLK